MSLINPAFIREVGAIAMGSTTYEWILRHQVHVDPAKPNKYRDNKKSARPYWAGRGLKFAV